jgi:hypothetical protein
LILARRELQLRQLSILPRFDLTSGQVYSARATILAGPSDNMIRTVQTDRLALDLRLSICKAVSAVRRGVDIETQKWLCVIDLFGVSYEGTLPYIMLVCDEPWLGLFAVAPPNPPAVEAGDRPDGRVSYSR